MVQRALFIAGRIRSTLAGASMTISNNGVGKLDIDMMQLIHNHNFSNFDV
jgi:hypothetical protein